MKNDELISVSTEAFRFVPEQKTSRPKPFFDQLLNGINNLQLLLLRGIAVFGLLLAIWIGVQIVQNNQVVIEPFSVPKQLHERGMTGEVVANRIWSALHHIQTNSGSQKERVTVTPQNLQYDFVVPETGFSVRSFTTMLRNVFWEPPRRISGELICLQSTCDLSSVHLTIRLQAGEDLSVWDLVPDVGSNGLPEFQSASEKLVEHMDPYILAACHFTNADTEKPGIAIATRLLGPQEPDQAWAANLLGLFAYRRKDYSAAQDFFRQSIESSESHKISTFNAPWNGLGVVYLATEEYDLAQGAFQKPSKLTLKTQFPGTILESFKATLVTILPLLPRCARLSHWTLTIHMPGTRWDWSICKLGSRRTPTKTLNAQSSSIPTTRNLGSASLFITTKMGIFPLA